MIKVRCPVCERWMHSRGPKEWPHWPFCSSRCKLIDLGRWLGGDYRLESQIQAEDTEPDDLTRPLKSGRSFGRSNREEA